MTEIETEDEQFPAHFGKYRWDLDNATREEILKDDNMDASTLDFFQSLFVRFKGLHEGMFMGFYHNTTLQNTLDDTECLG